MGGGGWRGSRKEALCQGAVKAELGGGREEPSRQASILRGDADDADTIWALLQNFISTNS